MFDFLKKKIKESIENIKGVFTKKEEIKENIEKKLEEKAIVDKVKEEVEKPEVGKISPEELRVEEEILEEVEDKEEKEIKEAEVKLKEEAKELKEEIEEFSKEEIPSSKKAKVKKKPKEEKKSFLQSVTSAIFEKKLSDEEFDKIFKNLEISLLEANIAYEVIQLIKENLKKELVKSQVKRGKVEETIINSIKETMREVMQEFDVDKIIKKVNEKAPEPVIFLFLGVNGVGKTTSLAKFCKMLQNMGLTCVIAASDTFRAASIEQLEKHASKLKVKLIKHQYGADAAAVAFDAIQYAKANHINCVLIDTAGRQHTNTNLMDELKKVKRISKPDFTIFVADALTGNDAVEQAREFEEKIGFDFSILTKTDVDQKGGAILSVSYISGKPIGFLGFGQEYENLKVFKKEEIIEKIIA